MGQIKISFIFFAVLFCINVRAQEIGDQFHNWNLSYGRTGTPGDQLKAGLEYAQSTKFSYYMESALEWSKHLGLRYTSFGFAVGGRYYLYGGNDMNIVRKINFLAGINGVLQYEDEATLMKNRTLFEKLNYGLAGQVIGEYYFDQTIGFFVGIEQKYMFNKTFGNTNYSVFAGLRIHFGNK
ncbi:MAG: hypothetical protein K2X69_13455 [Silvanigrellaceae bacterium]|nr:hypothetical protein [Silvanigrellaceae bacterium]